MAIRAGCSARSAPSGWRRWPATGASCAASPTSTTTSPTTCSSRAGIRHQQADPAGAPALPAAIGYFSPEFGIAAVLPQYSGGLGILAGDHLKAASDLGVPIIGVGLLYRSGYFSQSLSRDGWQLERYPSLDPQGLPIRILREQSDDPGSPPVRITLALPGGRALHAQVWVVDVGRVPLLLLDSDIEDNDADRPPDHRPPLRRRQGAPPRAGTAARASAASGRSAPTAPRPARRRPRSFTPTKGTPASSASSASAN